MEGANQEDLLSRMEAQAERFFGSRPHRLSGKVEVEVIEEVRTVAGKQVMSVWEGSAYYESMP